MKSKAGQVLLMTVGKGYEMDIIHSLYAPMERSLVKGEWAKILLLPSLQTKAHAEQLRARNPDLPIDVVELPKDGMEDNADLCFDFYDHVIGNLEKAGWNSGQMTVDFTRGTKAMSAALLLAATNRGVRALRYVTGERGPLGTVVPGTEKVFDFASTRATARRDLRLAIAFVKTLQFEAALAILEPQSDWCNRFPGLVAKEAAAIAWLARFWGAWSRFDYSESLRLLGERPELPGDLEKLGPKAGHCETISRLGKPMPLALTDREPYVLLLAADILASARRAEQQGDYEDALLRGYRVVELIGQARLFKHGLDSENLDRNRPEVQSWFHYLEKKKERVPEERKGRTSIAREMVARLLKHMKDPLGERLIDVAENGPLRVKARNQSILIHGYETQARTEKKELLSSALSDVEKLLSEVMGTKTPLAGVTFPF